MSVPSVYTLSTDFHDLSIKEDLSSADEQIILKVTREIKAGKTCSEALRGLPADFFLDKNQERAKKVFSFALGEILGNEVFFPTSSLPHSISLQGVNDIEAVSGSIDHSIFRLCSTQGVQNDIPKSSCDNHHIHVYQVASQYNCSEAPSPFTPPVGEAMLCSEHDRTQGPLAQRTNPAAFELVTAFLTHLGFNMLENVLPKEWNTYTEESPVVHGYLRPNNQNLDRMVNEFEDHFQKLESVCYGSAVKNWVDSSRVANTVYILLQAAPAIGYCNRDIDPEETQDLQKLAAFANYVALFNAGIQLAKQHQKPVVLHATAVGGGVFQNQTPYIQFGFEKAALILQKQMKEVGAMVQLEAFRNTGVVKEMADRLKISSGKRIGE